MVGRKGLRLEARKSNIFDRNPKRNEYLQEDTKIRHKIRLQFFQIFTLPPFRQGKFEPIKDVFGLN